MYKLVVVHKGKIEKNIPLRGESIIIGRKVESNIQLEEKLVSARHAEIQIKNNGVTIRDLDSTNGTSVNGSPITETRLQTGDQISIGNYKLIFVTEHGDDEDPDATIMVSSGRSATNRAPTASSETSFAGKIIVVVLAITAIGLIAGSILTFM